MAVIVRHKPSGNKFVLLGTGYGAFKASHPSILLGSLSPTEKTGEFTMAAVCNYEGKIFWCESDDLEVMEIDGDSPAYLLTG